MTDIVNSPRKWTFIHLSDIHFRGRLKTGEDVFNQDIRDQLLLDLQRLQQAGQKVDAILLSGDVAFSGKASEYDAARAFLNQACDNLELPQSDVWMIPGNHDVDRSTIPYHVTNWHGKMKDPRVGYKDRQSELDTVIRLDEAQCKSHVLSTLGAYNNFARNYDCESALHPFLHWETIIGELDKGVVIKLRGLNSAFLCSDKDVRGPTTMVGTQQSMIREEPNTISIVMCHHPESWLADGGELMKHLRVRSNLALFGHEHEADIVIHDKLMVLHAGAVNPELIEQAKASYNVSTLWVDQQQLFIEVQRREFSREEKKFVAHHFSDQKTRMHQQTLTLKKTVQTAVQPKSNGGEAPPMSELNQALLIRRLTFFLLDLNEGARMTVVQNLSLLTPEMENLDGRDLYFAVIDEAKKRRQLLDLWHEVAKHHRKMPAEPDSGVPDA